MATIKKLVYVGLEPEIREQLLRIGKQQDRNLSWLIRQAVHEYIERNTSNGTKRVRAGNA